MAIVDKLTLGLIRADYIWFTMLKDGPTKSDLRIRRIDPHQSMCNDCLHGRHDCIVKDCPCICNEPSFALNVKEKRDSHGAVEG